MNVINKKYFLLLLNLTDKNKRYFDQEGKIPNVIIWMEIPNLEGILLSEMSSIKSDKELPPGNPLEAIKSNLFSVSFLPHFFCHYS